MRRSLRPVLSLALLAALGGPAFSQGETGFLRGRGKFDVVVSYINDSYDEFWVGDTKMSAPPVGEVTREAFVLYAAYGLNDDIDLSVNAAYVETESDGTGGFSDENDPQDVVVQAKWRFYQARAGAGAVSFLLAPGIKQPMTDYEENDVTAIGDGQTDVRGRVIGHYQADNGLFASLEAGYDRRNGAPADELPVNFTVGGTYANLTLAPFFSRVDSKGGIDIGQGDFPEVEEDYTRYGLGAFYRFNESVGLTANYRTTDDGKNTGDVDGFSFGVVLRR